MILVFLITILVVLFGLSALLQWLWNITCPDVFHLPKITYWQAFRLLLIAAILFGGFHFFSGGTTPINLW